MGWDAFALVEYDEHFKITGRLADVFQKVSDEVKEKTGTVDGLLAKGGLDVDDCAYMLEHATGLSAWSVEWTADYVKELNDRANWNFEYPIEDAWAYWSARRFLETCASEGLPIRFSW